MSILMVNSMYAVLSSALSAVHPSVKFSAFLDDSKIWTRVNDQQALADAYDTICNFDVDIGQVLNVDKTAVATRRQKNASRFLLKVGRVCKTKKQVKSLGFSHQFSKKRSPSHQNDRVDSARTTMLKISQLPLPPNLKAIHVHCNGHSKWVHGSEVQGPSKQALARLRTVTAKVFTKKRNNMRCPFLLFATLQDAWLDPFAKWVQHVLLKLRRLAYVKPSLLVEILVKVRETPAPVNPTTNGVIGVVAYLFAELGWKVVDPNSFLIELSDHQHSSLKAGSKEAFLEILARDVRKYLLNQSPERHDNPTPGQYGTPDIFLSGFLLDTTFAKDDDFRYLRKHLQSLPPNISYTRGILSALLSGSVYNGRRYKAAGLRDSAACPHCGQHETHQHMFYDCEAAQEHAPARGHEPLLSWVTGIFFEPPHLRRDVRSLSQIWSLPLVETRWRPHSEIFVDGSVFHQRWAPIRSGAAAVTVPNLFEHAVSVQGSSVNSFRCELFAVILAIHMTEGDITIASDCASVLRRAKFLQARNYQWDCVFQFENPDLWELFLKVAQAHTGTITFVKVKAHTDANSGQGPLLTAGNERADYVAKAAAKALATQLAEEFQPYLDRAVAVQAHLVATLVRRTNEHQLAPFDEDEPASVGPSETHLCTCKPLRRLTGKQQRVCYKSCAFMVTRF